MTKYVSSAMSGNDMLLGFQRKQRQIRKEKVSIILHGVVMEDVPE